MGKILEDYDTLYVVDTVSSLGGDDVFVDGIVNTEKLREFIIDSFQDTDKLKYNDLLSLNTNIFKVEEILKEKIAINPNDIFLIDEDKIIKKKQI